MLTLRRLVRTPTTFTGWHRPSGLVAYYANSIAHFFATRGGQAAAVPPARQAAAKAVDPRSRPRPHVAIDGPLARALEAAGYAVYNWDYPSRVMACAALVDALEAYVAECRGQSAAWTS